MQVQMTFVLLLAQSVIYLLSLNQVVVKQKTICNLHENNCYRMKEFVHQTLKLSLRG